LLNIAPATPVLLAPIDLTTVFDAWAEGLAKSQKAAATAARRLTLESLPLPFA
jgi:hypothetical protein